MQSQGTTGYYLGLRKSGGTDVSESTLPRKLTALSLQPLPPFQIWLQGRGHSACPSQSYHLLLPTAPSLGCFCSLGIISSHPPSPSPPPRPLPVPFASSILLLSISPPLLGPNSGHGHLQLGPLQISPLTLRPPLSSRALEITSICHVTTLYPPVLKPLMAAHIQQDPIHSLSSILGLPPCPCPCQYLWLHSVLLQPLPH